MTDQHTPPPSDAPDAADRLRVDVPILLNNLRLFASKLRGEHHPMSATFMVQAADTIDWLSAELTEARSAQAAAEHRYADLVEELAITDKLLAERDRILDALPCPEHGQCVPYVLDWINARRDLATPEAEFDKERQWYSREMEALRSYIGVLEVKLGITSAALDDSADQTGTDGDGSDSADGSGAE